MSFSLFFRFLAPVIPEFFFCPAFSRDANFRTCVGWLVFSWNVQDCPIKCCSTVNSADSIAADNFIRGRRYFDIGVEKTF